MKTDTVYFLTSSLSGGGAEAVCVNLANALADKGVNVHILVLNEKKSVYHSEINSNVSYDILGVSKSRYAFFKLYSWVQLNKPSKVIVFNYELSLVMILVKLLSFRCVRVFSRNINNFNKKYENRGVKGKVIKALVSIFYGKSDFVINQCDLMQKQFNQCFPRLHLKNTVIYNPLNKKFDFDYPGILAMKDSSVEPYFLCVGRLSKQKDFSFAIDSFSLFLKKMPNYRLIILGEGETLAQLRYQTEKLGVSDSIMFEGFSRELSKYYANATAVLLTSEFEGFPNVLVESIAHATPVISVDCESGPSEIIQEGVNGYLVKNKTIENFAKKMINLVVEEQLDPYQVYESSRRFSIDKVVLDWEKIL